MYSTCAAFVYQLNGDKFYFSSTPSTLIFFANVEQKRDGRKIMQIAKCKIKQTNKNKRNKLKPQITHAHSGSNLAQETKRVVISL